ncbi:hypothetical protein MRX96_054087, partial [Rhipicephalus microplus]
INGAIKKLVEQHFITCAANTTTSFVYLLESKVQEPPECPPVWTGRFPHAIPLSSGAQDHLRHPHLRQ